MLARPASARICEVLNAAKEERVRQVIADHSEPRKGVTKGPTDFTVRMELLERESVMLHRKIVHELRLDRNPRVNCYGDGLGTDGQDDHEGFDGGSSDVDPSTSSAGGSTSAGGGAEDKKGPREPVRDLSFLESTEKFLRHEFVGSFHAFTYVLQWCNLVDHDRAAEQGQSRGEDVVEYEETCPRMGPQMLRMQRACARVRGSSGEKTTIILKPPSNVVLCDPAGEAEASARGS
eukprot:g20692.t1